jgi:RNA polymerase primary sigma factor
MASRTNIENHLIPPDKDQGYFDYSEQPDASPDEFEDLLPLELEGLNLPDDAADLDEGDLTTMDFRDINYRDDCCEREDDYGDRDYADDRQLSLDLSPGKLEKVDDPIRVYLREMGRIPLLSRQQEVTLSRQIEEGHRIVQEAIFETPLAIAEVRKLLNQILTGKKKGSNVIDMAIPNASASDREAKYIKTARRLMDYLKNVELEMRVQERRLKYENLSPDDEEDIRRELESNRKELINTLKQIKIDREELSKISGKIKEVARNMADLENMIRRTEEVCNMPVEQICRLVRNRALGKIEPPDSPPVTELQKKGKKNNK